ncbi:hypothetical protein AKG98_2845 [Moritella sp. JT01]|nr:hypothetical protein AKG98_2845 [Moritella sp. JT01]
MLGLYSKPRHKSIIVQNITTFKYTKVVLKTSAYDYFLSYYGIKQFKTQKKGQKQAIKIKS